MRPFLYMILLSWRDFARGRFYFCGEAVNAGDEATRGLVRSNFTLYFASFRPGEKKMAV